MALEMLPTRNGVAGLIRSPAALASPAAAVVVVPLRTTRTAPPPSRSPTKSTSRSSRSGWAVTGVVAGGTASAESVVELIGVCAAELDLGKPLSQSGTV